jgi:hypothetical protein
MKLYTLTARKENNDLAYITGLNGQNETADICMEMDKRNLDENTIDILKSELHFTDSPDENFIYSDIFIYPDDIDGRTYGSITFNVETLDIN